MNVWKIGSRLGKQGPSVLGMFADYECVFFGDSHGSYIGDWETVTAGDFFIICDGATPVALGKAVGRFKSCEESGIRFTAKEKREVIADIDAVICPAKIVILPQNEQDAYPGTDPRKRFCRYNNHEVIRTLSSRWKKLTKKGDFRIIPRTVSLFAGNDSIFASDIKYRIPIYQRPYSWGEDELRRLMDTLMESVKMNEPEPVFMGTMQLSQPIPLSSDYSKKAFFIIDGQQRITTFMILRNALEKHLGRPIEPYAEDRLRTTVSGGEEQIKLDEYSAFLKDPNPGQDYERNTYIRNYRIIESLLAEYCCREEAEDEKTMAEMLYEFIGSDKIKFVVIETHAGLSKTLQIFNTINTAGMDLNATDLFKIRFFEYLKEQDQDTQDSIIFERISDVYAGIEAYNRTEISPETLSMQDVLRTCQRIISAREGLPQSVFSKSYETFFEELFDTLLGIRTHDEFKGLDTAKTILSINDLHGIVECYKESYRLLAADWNYRIICNMIWETRYGLVAYDLPIIARFFGAIDQEQIFEFTLLLFKLLCPPSLCYARRINAAESALIEISRKLAKSENNGAAVLNACLAEWCFDGRSLEDMLTAACESEVAGNPKWKYLICRLVEYLKTDSKDKDLFKRLWANIDIEHVQSYTDESDADKVWNEWGGELNCLGNLILLESGINRSIKNHAQKKAEAYGMSAFVSARELAGRVNCWTKDAAEARRKENTEMIKDFILNRKQIH